MSECRIIATPAENGATDLAVRGEWSEDIVDRIRSVNLGKLLLMGVVWPDFRGLAPVASNITNLSLKGITATSHGLEQLVHIRRLQLDEPLKPVVNLAVFSELEDVFLMWDKKYPGSFFSLPNLRSMMLRDYSEVGCQDIARAKSLEHLDLRKGSLRSLDGIGEIRSLRSLSLSYIRNLEDISAISGLPQLQSLHIEACPKVADLSSIGSLRSLSRLHIEKVNAEWDGLDWVGQLPFLRVVVNDAEVKKLDWAPVFEHAMLQEFSTRTHQGYEASEELIGAMAVRYGKTIMSVKIFPPKRKPAISIEFGGKGS